MEHLLAADLRSRLTSLDLSEPKKVLQSLGATSKTIRTLEQAKMVASEIVNGTTKGLERLRLAILFFDVPMHLHRSIATRWLECGRPSVSDFAPYAAYVLTIEIFFQLALAADLISSDRPSNRMDIAYLFYLPFCDLFVSGDKLHRKCAPLFLRGDQEFAWGHDLKADLKRMNTHYLELPEAERDKGIMAFAHGPPKEGDFLTAQIYDRLYPTWRDREPMPPLSPDKSRAIADELLAFSQSTDRLHGQGAYRDEEIKALSIERYIRKRKGSWWQVPKDLPAP